jgi:adenylate kinase family enzyme
MSLNVNTFTRTNIEKVLCEGGTLDCYPTHTNPYLIIKAGPPGSGKSSTQSNNLVLSLGINPKDAVKMDIDIVNSSFKSFRNKTYNIRKSYNGKTLNNKFFNNLSKIHKNHTTLKNKNTNKSMISHTMSVFSRAIDGHKHIIFDTTSPINFIIDSFKNKLIKNKYTIVVIFHRADIKTLQERILKRGENLYAQQGYYRAYNMKELPNVIKKLEINLEEYIKPLYDEQIISNIKYINS